MRWLATLLWAIAALFCLAPALAAGGPGILTIDRADALLEPDGGTPRQGEIDLARRWDREFPGLGGRATYRITLPPRVDEEPMALLFSRVGNQVHVLVNDITVQRWGTLGNPLFDATKTVRMVTLPATLLHADRPNELRVEVTIQGQRLGGLSVVRYGPVPLIEKLYADQIRWRDLAMLVFAAGLVGMGALTAVLWWRQRDPFYGWFSIAALLGVVRVVDRAWPDVPVSWPLWGAIAAICYTAHVALMCRFALIAVGAISRRMSRAIDGVIVAVSVLDALAFALGMPMLMTIGFTFIPVLGFATLALVTREAFVSRSAKAWVLAVAIAGALAAGTHDVVMIRIAGASGLYNTYIQHGMFVFVLVMTWFVADRYSRSVASFRELNADLSRRVEERERQLHRAFDSLREQQHHQSVSIERQRIMREIHDGVGSQLVGLLNMVTRKGADPAALKEQVLMALDEMRMAVDSLQPAHDDLTTLLATLRYRLQPRLQAAGIEVIWDVAELPELRQLSPPVVLHVQRILLEAFTNVMKHARASQVEVQVRWRDESAPRVMLRITDNGIGFPAGAGAQEAQAHGRGLDNMRARATAIGASFDVRHSPGRGVSISLEWQVERAAPSSGFHDNPVHG
ncbi:ATP-binding protein [Variovorax sp. J2P1-59]|uniref:sensor histidine kinase n=1 Tax=Variovorax flavidus TaxID=3053501 RepID=UPI00257654E9|nr:ATP-binding protein [Variovorax sp. J2P1-59]MDM0077870.1 ATP-binding protein [Variovorax sp. J2P1-59]